MIVFNFWGPGWRIDSVDLIEGPIERAERDNSLSGKSFAERNFCL